ncbi:MAG: aspartate 1-decarboxylase [Planctomycetota bacterium]|nr:aspartate 1-decarboxylase [Planctomycetota bacterium]
MLREVLFGKIHMACVTHCDPSYMGSITIDPDLLDEVGMVVNEKVLIADATNGNRFETYIFRGEEGSRQIMVNGAAADLTGVGHRLLILSFCQLDQHELETHRPKVIICDEHNEIVKRLTYPASMSVPETIIPHTI